MSKRSIVIAVVIGVIIIGFLSISYNSLVKKDQHVNYTWSEVQNVYQRRLDLIPNLIRIVKGATDYEQSTLQKIAEARAKASSGVDASTYSAQTQAQNAVALATNNLIINIENYPVLQGTRTFKDLQVQLEGTERRIKFARKDFNEAIATYNSSVRSFPTSIAASIFSFPVRNGFTADDGAENMVPINFK